MVEPIAAYDLPEPAKAQLLTLAAESDLLLIGELHGTQEVPRLMLGLLPALADLGYGGLALEMLTCEHDQLLRCAQGKDSPPPMFGLSNFRDGRGNAQTFSLIQQAVQDGWQLLCFDVDFMQEGDAWSVRDRGMAQNLLHQWEQLCPERKVLGVCGNHHSRLVPPTEPTELWPSFAYSVQQARRDLRVSSVKVKHQCGAYFNGEVQTFDNGAEFCASQAEVHPADWLGHTLDLHLPCATPATFLKDEESKESRKELPQ